MSKMRRFQLLAGLAAILGGGLQGAPQGRREPRRISRDYPLTPKQRRARAASKRARKARRTERRTRKH